MNGRLNHSRLAAQLLRDAATFFDNLANENEVLQQQMTENAITFRAVADLVEKDPLGYIPEDADDHRN